MDATDFTEALANGMGDIPINTLDIDYIETGVRFIDGVGVATLTVEIGGGDRFRLTIEKSPDKGFPESTVNYRRIVEDIKALLP
jgi:hypothetical protein